MGLAEMPDYRSDIDARFSLVVGADDPRYIAIARSLPAPVTVIADSGHDPLLEQPAGLSTALTAALARLTA
jgi:pimeloyl-ACP methyl ester carboxylesterase